MALLGVLLAGCGKKGPPLAPIVRIPAQIETISARRVGTDVYVTLTVPRENIDDSTPADIGHIDIYGYTGYMAPPRARWAELGTVIASVPVLPALAPGAPAESTPRTSAGTTQGAAITIRETLTPDDFVHGPTDPLPPTLGRTVPEAPVQEPAPQQLRRFYLAIPFNPRGRPGPPGASAEVALTETIEPPPAPRVLYSAVAMTIAWEPAGGLLGFILDRELPREREPFDVVPGAAPVVSSALPVGPTRYSVYRELEPDPLALPVEALRAPWNAVPPAAIGEPVAALALQDRVEFERMRCYAIRSVRGTPPEIVESDLSPRTCVRPIDLFPPAPPAAPEAVAAEGAISLIWEPSAELDIGGYVVLRGEAGGATLQPLTATPIVEASFRDTTVVPGRRYVYAIVAVDNRVPLGNRSAPSALVEETAR